MNPTPRFYPVVLAVFVTALVVSNFIAVKLVILAGLSLDAAVIIFPLSYIIGDVLTEVYGFARARQAIWTGFFCNLLAVLAVAVALRLPAAPFWVLSGFPSPQAAQGAYTAVLGWAPRILVASFAAYVVGEFLNAMILSRLKVRTAGRHLWLRTIGSTLVGQGTDSAVFITLAFAGVFRGADLATAILSQWAFKVAYEVLATPLTYWVVNTLKRAEGMDVYDREIRFNPLGG
ncbi:MAG: queuosine precursor transporter [Anaerolineae bacterium]